MSLSLKDEVKFGRSLLSSCKGHGHAFGLFSKELSHHNAHMTDMIRSDLKPKWTQEPSGVPCTVDC